MKPSSRALGVILLALLTTACAPAPGSGRALEQTARSASSSRTLVIIGGGELQSFAWKKILPSGAATSIRTGGEEILNARLTLMSERGLPQPFLAESLPSLADESWRVFPDGTMETLYRLRPNLVWHDGVSLTAEDFAFAHRVYANPEFGVSTTGGIKYIQSVTTLDARSVVLHWNQPYPDVLDEVNLLPPLPSHILERPYAELAAELFMSLPFWRDEYVGAGPWRLDRRAVGSFFEASAFDGFVFGRPKLHRIRVVYIPDPNVMVATLLSGDAHFVMEGLLYGEDGLVLERGWGGTGGTVWWEAISGRVMEMQMRPELAIPRELSTDVRVRRAVAFAMDREAMMEGVTTGKGLLRDVYTHPQADYYDTVLRAVAKRYRYEPRQAEQLLSEAGFARGGDGAWSTPRGEPFSLEQWYLAASNNERESQILIDTLRRFGIDATSHLFGNQRTSAEDRVKTPGLFGGTKVFPDYHSRDIARPENRWAGSNRFGYSNPELDRLLDVYYTTLDRPQRIQQMAQIERLAMDDLPAIPLYYNPRVIAFVAGLDGVGRKLVESAGIERDIWGWTWHS